MARPSKKLRQHEMLKKKYWAKEAAFIPPKNGWIKAPRTLPLLLSLIASKKVSGRKDPSTVYMELLSHRWDSGVAEINNEAEHAFGSGYSGRRAVRTWQERVSILEQVGLIRAVGTSLQKYRYVLLLDPDVAVAEMKKKGLVSAHWEEAYHSRRPDDPESEIEQLVPSKLTASMSSKSNQKK